MGKWKSTLLVLTGFLTLGAAATMTTSAKAKKTPVTVNVVFNVRDRNAMNTYVNQTVDPTSVNYHRYLTPQQVADRFGRTNAEISDFTKYFNSVSSEIRRLSWQFCHESPGVSKKFGEGV